MLAAWVRHQDYNFVFDDTNAVSRSLVSGDTVAMLKSPVDANRAMCALSCSWQFVASSLTRQTTPSTCHAFDALHQSVLKGLPAGLVQCLTSDS